MLPGPIKSNEKTDVKPIVKNPMPVNQETGADRFYLEQLRRMQAKGWSIKRVMPQVLGPKLIGYQPTFWEDPVRVARWHNAVMAAPKGWTPPEWLDIDRLNKAFYYFQQRNNNKPWTEWKYLNEADPGRGYMQSLQVPPNDFLWPIDRTLVNQNIAAAKRGEVAWTALSADQRAAILKSPTFDMSEWDVTVQNDMMADPNFDWSKLPAWQKPLHDILGQPIVAGIAQSLPMAGLAFVGSGFNPAAGLGALALGAAGGAAQMVPADNPYFGWVNEFGTALLMGMSFPVQTVESLGGLAGQTLASLIDPKKYGDVSEILGSAEKIRAAYQAGRSTFEGSWFGPEMIADPLQMLTANYQALQAIFNGGLTEEKAREILEANPVTFMNPDGTFNWGKVWRIGSEHPEQTGEILDVMAQTRNAIAAGADPVNTVNKVIMQYGLTGLERDMVLKFVADPFMYLPRYVNRGLANEIAGKTIFGEGQTLIGQIAEGVMGPRFEEALRTTVGLKSAGSKYSAIIRTAFMGLDEATAAAKAASMSRYARFVAGITDVGTIRAGKYTRTIGLMDKPTVEVKGIRRFVNYLSTLTPDERAVSGQAMAQEHLRGWLNQFTDPVEANKFLRALANGDMETAAAMSKATIGSPEFYTILPAIKDFIANKLPDLIAVWDNQPTQERITMLRNLAAALDMTPQNLLDSLEQTGDAARTFEQFRLKLAGTTDSNMMQQAVSMLDDITNGRFTPTDMQAIADLFTGPTKIPWDARLWNMMVGSAFDLHFAEWGKTYFGVSQDSAFFRFSHVLKAAQGILLLGGNPAYFVRNTINDITSRDATGVGGFLSPKQAQGWLDRFGVLPSRLKEGIGMIGESPVHFEGENATARMAATTRMGKGPVATADAFLRKVSSKMPFTRLSGWVESLEGQQAFVIGMRKMWGRVWNRETGFRKMPPELATALQAIHPDAPNIIYAAIEGGMNREEIYNSIYSQQRVESARGYIRETAERLGVSATQAATMLDQLGVIDKLDAVLHGAKTPDQIRAAYRNIDRYAQDQVELYRAKRLATRAAEVGDRIKVEGAPALIDVLLDTNNKNIDAWLEQFITFGDVASQLDEITDVPRRNMLWRDARITNARRWNKTNADELTTYKGLMDGLKWSDEPEVVEFMSKLVEVNRVKAETYQRQADAMDAWHAKYTDNWNHPNKWTEWADIMAATDKDFVAMFKAEHDGLIAQGNAMASMLERMYGKLLGETYRKGWKDVVRARDGMVALVKQRRAEFGQLEYNDRMAAKAAFYQSEYPALIVQFGQIRQWFGEDLQAAISGNKPGPHTPPVTKVPPPDLGAAADAEVAGYEAHTLEVKANLVALVNQYPDITSQLNLTDNAGVIVPANEEVLLNFVRKFGGAEGANIRTVADMEGRLDVVKRALDNKRSNLGVAQAGNIAIIPKVETTNIQPGNEVLLNDQRRVVLDHWNEDGTFTATDGQVYENHIIGVVVEPVTDVKPNLTDVKPNLTDVKPNLTDVKQNVTPEAPPSPPPPKLSPTDTARLWLTEGAPGKYEGIVFDPNARQEPVTFRQFADYNKPLTRPLEDMFNDMLREANETSTKQEILQYIKDNTPLTTRLFQEIVGDRAGRGSKVPPGVFTKAGKDVDYVGQSLIEGGYLTEDARSNFVDAVSQIVRRSIDGEKVYPIGEVVHDWIKGVGGADEVKTNIQRILAGLESPDAKRVQAIKDEAFSRMIERIQEYDDARNYLDIPFDENASPVTAEIAAFSRSLDYLMDMEPVAGLKKTMEKFEDYSSIVENFADDIPPELEKQMTIALQKLFVLRDKYTLKAGEINAVAGGEASGSLVTNKRLFEEYLRDVTGQPEDKIAATMEIMGAVEKWYTRVTGDTPEKVYEIYAKMTREAAEGGLEQVIGPENYLDRALSPEAMQEYARVMVREGEKALRQAAEGEQRMDQRIALLDAAYKINPEVAEAVAKNLIARKLLQGGMGATTFTPDGKAIMHFYENANASTIIHENMHVWRRIMDNLAKTGNPEIVKDLQTIHHYARLKKLEGRWEAPNSNGRMAIVQRGEKFVFIDNGTERIVSTFEEANYFLENEMLSRAYERYMAEGIAPTPALVKVFNNFKRWLVEIYGTITGSPIDVKITPEITDFFDRLMGKEPPERVTFTKARIEYTRGPNGETVVTAVPEAGEVWRKTDAWTMTLDEWQPVVEDGTFYEDLWNGSPEFDRATDLYNQSEEVLKTITPEMDQKQARGIKAHAEMLRLKADLVGQDWAASLDHDVVVRKAMEAGLEIPKNVMEDYWSRNPQSAARPLVPIEAALKVETPLPVKYDDIVKVRTGQEGKVVGIGDNRIPPYDKFILVEYDGKFYSVRPGDIVEIVNSAPVKWGTLDEFAAQHGESTSNPEIVERYNSIAERERRMAPIGEMVPTAGSENVYPTGPIPDGAMHGMSYEDWKQRLNAVFYPGEHYNETDAWFLQDRTLVAREWGVKGAKTADEAYRILWEQFQKPYVPETPEQIRTKLAPTEVNAPERIFQGKDQAEYTATQSNLTRFTEKWAGLQHAAQASDLVKGDIGRFLDDVRRSRITWEEASNMAIDARNLGLLTQAKIDMIAEASRQMVMRGEVIPARQGGSVEEQALRQLSHDEFITKVRAEKQGNDWQFGIKDSNLQLEHIPIATDDIRVAIEEFYKWQHPELGEKAPIPEPLFPSQKVAEEAPTMRTRTHGELLADPEYTRRQERIKLLNAPVSTEPGLGFAGEAGQVDMFAPQQYGLGLEVPKVGPEVAPVSPEPIVVSGKVALDNAGTATHAGDIIRMSNGDQALVKGVTIDDQLLLADGDTVAPKEVTNVAVQENIFSGASAPETNRYTMINDLLARIKNDVFFEKSRDFETFIKEYGFDLENEADLNMAYDIMEGAYNLRAREIRADIEKQNAPLVYSLTQLDALENSLTTARRTLSKMRLQQFSTPLPISEAAGYAADVRPGDVVGEPTAGTGNLIDQFSGKAGINVKVNEIEANRRAVLEMLGYKPTGLDLMSSEWVIQNGQKAGPWADVIITNPPWGSYSTNKYGTALNTPVLLNDWSQRFTYLTMQRLAEDGRLVGVMPTNWLYNKDRVTGQINLKPSLFFQWLEKNYTVQAVVESPAGAYKNRGTDVGSLMVVIDKTTPLIDRPVPVLRFGEHAPKNWTEYAEVIKSIPKRTPEAITHGQEQLKSTVAGPNESGIVDPAARAGLATSDPDLIGQPVADIADRAVERGGIGGLGRDFDAGVVGVGPKGVSTRPGEAGRGQETTAGAELVGQKPQPVQRRNQPKPYTPAFIERRNAGKIAVKSSGSFTEYVGRSPLRSDDVVHPHPNVIVETKGLSGVPYPALEEAYRPSPGVMRAMENRTLSYDGNLDPIWAAIQQNDKYRMGMLVADDVGTGKSRVGAGFVIDRIEKGHKRILVITANEQNIHNLMDVEFPQVWGGQADENGAYLGNPPKDFPAKRIYLNGKNFPDVKRGDVEIPTFEQPTVYFITKDEFMYFSDKIKNLRPTAVVVDEAHNFKNIGNAKRGLAWVDSHKDWIARDVSMLYLTATPGVDISDLQYLFGLKVWALDGFEDWIKVIIGEMSPEKAKEVRANKLTLDQWVDQVEAARNKIVAVPETLNREGAYGYQEKFEALTVGKVSTYKGTGYRSDNYRMVIGNNTYKTRLMTNESMAVIAADVLNRKIGDTPLTDFSTNDFFRMVADAGDEVDSLFPTPTRDVIQSIGIREASDILNKKGSWGKNKSITAFEATLPASHTEQIMRELKVAGSYMSRDISRTGVEFNVIERLPTPAELVNINNRIRFYRKVYEAWSRYGAMNKGPKKFAATFGINGDLQADAKRALFDMRLPSVIDEAHNAVANGEQVVISIVSVSEVTGETGSLASAISKINTQQVDKISDGVYTDPSEIPEALVDIMSMREELNGMPKLASPVDILKDAFGNKIDFVTGKTSPRAREQAAYNFQHNKLDVIVISDAGKEGINLHDITGKRRVHMIVADYDWSATKFKQDMGRVDRTGELSSPKIDIVHSGSAGEKKFVATISNRMAGVGAVSKGSSGSTGTGMMTDLFELSTAIDKIAVNAAWMDLEPSQRALFLDHFFDDVGTSGVKKSTLQTDANTLKKFLLALQTIEMEDANKIYALYEVKRQELHASGGADESIKTATNTGHILRQVDLGPNLRLSEVKDAGGHKFAIVDGVLTPHMNALKGLSTAGEEAYLRYQDSGRAWMRWVEFFDPEKNTYAVGLKVNPTRIKDVAEYFGQFMGTAHTPESVTVDLRAGDRIKLIGHEMSQWELYIGKGGAREDKIVVDGAKMRDKDVLMNNGASYNAVGNFFFVTPEKLQDFIKRFPIKNDVAPPLSGEAVEPGPLFQSADPRVPFGAYDQSNPSPDQGQVLDDGWTQYVRPLLNAMAEEGVRRSQQPVLRVGGADDATQAMLARYLNQVNQDMSGAKLQTIRWGELQRDEALLNYNRRYGFDKFLDMIFPYQFWYTRSMINWAGRALDRPAWFSNYARLYMATNTYKTNTPERMRGKIAIPAPFLPDWMGDTLYVDPWSAIFPFAQFAQPFNMLMKDQNTMTINTSRILQGWAADGTMDMATAQEALATQSGPAWEKAMAEASLSQQAEISNPFDLMRLMFGPAWYLSTPLNYLGIKVPLISTGKREDIQVLPLSKTALAAQAVTAGTWAEPIGDILSLFAKPEEWARSAAGLPKNGEYGDYYINRQLANMVGDNEISVEAFNLAVLERSGPAFDAAVKRVQLELAMRVPGAATAYALTHGTSLQELAASIPASVFGGQMLPAGELKFRGQTDEWNEAWDRHDAGDTEAITRFFDKYPEYEAYLGRKKKPEDLLRMFLVGQIWDNYMELSTGDKRMARAQMGVSFQDTFLDTNTRDYQAIEINTLALWARFLKGVVPKVEETKAVTEIPEAQMQTPILLPETIKVALKAWEAERDARFPGIMDVQSMYYATPEKQRAAFLVNFPEYTTYKKWRKEYINNHPDLRPFIDSYYAQDILSGKANASQEVIELLKLYYSQDYQDPLYGAADYLKDASMVLWEQLFDYQLFKQSLTDAAVAELRTIWEAAGQPGGSLETFLNDVIMPTLSQ